MKALAAALVLLAAAPAAAQQPRPPVQPPTLPIAELQTLDKITGRVSTIARPAPSTACTSYTFLAKSCIE